MSGLHADVQRAAVRRGGSRSGTIGLLAAVAVIVGYFMPWVPAAGIAQKSLSMKRGEISAAAASGEVREEMKKRLQDGEPLTGADWGAVLDSMADKAKLDDRQARRVAIIGVGVRALPWIAGALAVLLLALALPSQRLQQAGLMPVALGLRIFQSRYFAGPVLRIVMLLGLCVFVATHTLWLGSKIVDEDGGRTGSGIFLMMSGSGVALLSAFAGFGPGRTRALVWTLVLFLVLAGVAAYFANP